MAPPVMISPSAWANTQITAATTRARTRVPRAAGAGRYTPTAMMTRTTASTIEAASPWWATIEAAPRSSAASQLGSPSAIPAIMSCSACGARLTGSSVNQARLSHSTSHSARATGAPIARAATNGACLPGELRSVGHSSTASSA